MKTIFTFLGLTLCIFFGHISCTSEKTVTNSQSGFASYYARYLETEKQFRAEAMFFDGDSAKTIPATMATVSFNGKAMEPRDLQQGRGIRYRFQKSKADYTPDLLFEHSNLKGQTQSFKSAMPFLEKINVELPIRKSTGLQLSWEGTPLKKEESLVFLFTDEKNKGITKTVKGPTKESAVQLTPMQISRLKTGSGLLYLIRKHQQVDQKGKIRIDATFEFYANTIKIDVVE